MRINKFVAGASSLSRRSADDAISQGRVLVNGKVAENGLEVSSDDVVTLDGNELNQQAKLTIILNKPVGYICSRNGQGNKTIYDLLPEKYQHLNSVGRLDKESSGLLLLTNDGQLAQELSHPSHQKSKIYEIGLDRAISQSDFDAISKRGVELDDGNSKFALEGKGKNWTATLQEGRNRQIRRTFEALGYVVTKLHRTQFGEHRLGNLASGSFKEIR